MIHLDTNYLVGALVAGSDEDRRITELLLAGETLGISVMAWAEFLCGPLGPDDLRRAKTLTPDPVPMTPEDAAMAAALFNGTGRRRNSLADCLIAAIAIRAGAILATQNLDDFRRFERSGLRLLPI